MICLAIPTIVITGQGHRRTKRGSDRGGRLLVIEKNLLRSRYCRHCFARALESFERARTRIHEAAAARGGPARATWWARRSDAGSDAHAWRWRRQVRLPWLITGEPVREKKSFARTIHKLSPARRALLWLSIVQRFRNAHGKRNFRTRAAVRLRAGGTPHRCFELATAGPLAARMRSARCPRRRKRNSCACWKTARSAGWEQDRDARGLCGVLAATNNKIPNNVGSGHLRQVLYFRLNVFHINLPPLPRSQRGTCPAGGAHSARRQRQHGKHLAGNRRRKFVGPFSLSHTWPGKYPRGCRNVLGAPRSCVKKS